MTINGAGLMILLVDAALCLLTRGQFGAPAAMAAIGVVLLFVEKKP